MSRRLVSLIGLISLQVAAQSTPTAINFQSRLTTNDPIPQPVNGTKVMAFSIWDAVSGGTSLWSESALSVPVNDGSFSVILGTLTPIQASVFTGGASRYIQIVVEGDTLSPRQRLVTAPFAFMSEQAASGKAPFSAGVGGAQTGTLGGAVTNPATAPPGTYPVGVIGNYTGAGTGIGIYGEGTVGVLGSSGVSGNSGVIGYGLTGIEGQTDQAGGVGVYGECRDACLSGGYAGSFNGNVTVNGALNATYGTIMNSLTVGDAFTVTGLMTTYNGITLAGANSTVTVDSVGHFGAGPLNLPSGFHAINNSDVGGAFTVNGLMTTNNGITLQGANSTITVDSIKHFGAGPLNLPDGFHAPNNSDVVGTLTASLATITGGLTAGGITATTGAITGNLTVGGSLSVSGSKNFRIDHPLDPQCKFLYHASIESSEVLNLYSGNAVTDAQGLAAVALPDWFEALNRDFRYQLTPIGQFSQAIIEREIRDHRFIIRTDKPGVKVSWQVTGVRSDAAAREFHVEEAKPADRCQRPETSPSSPHH